MREKKAKSEKSSTPEAKKSKSDKKKKARKSDKANLEDLYANLTTRNSLGLKHFPVVLSELDFYALFVTGMVCRRNSELCLETLAYDF